MDIFQGAAGQAEAERPDRASARPVHGFIERGENNAFVFEQLAEIVCLVSVSACRDTLIVTSRVFCIDGCPETNSRYKLSYRAEVLVRRVCFLLRWRTRQAESRTDPGALGEPQRNGSRVWLLPTPTPGQLK